jgi:hypothetical protein
MKAHRPPACRAERDVPRRMGGAKDALDPNKVPRNSIRGSWELVAAVIGAVIEEGSLTRRPERIVMPSITKGWSSARKTRSGDPGRAVIAVTLGPG